MDRFGRLWVSIGDAANAANAQNRASLNGKVLRINRDGTIPSDNPVIAGVRNAVYSMGHRNPQGIAIRPGTDQVYAAEHGPDVNDEVNLIVAGGNYGWPCYTGFGTPYLAVAGCGPASAYREPMWASGGATLATSGASVRDRLAVGRLRRQPVRQHAQGERRSPLRGRRRRHDLHRPDDPLRWHLGPAAGDGVRPRRGQLYVTTSNGSGDQVIRISATQPTTATSPAPTATRRRPRSAPRPSRPAPHRDRRDRARLPRCPGRQCRRRAPRRAGPAGPAGPGPGCHRDRAHPARAAGHRCAGRDERRVGGGAAAARRVRRQRDGDAHRGRRPLRERGRGQQAMVRPWRGGGLHRHRHRLRRCIGRHAAGRHGRLAAAPRPAGSIPAATRPSCSGWHPQRIYVLGGTGVVSPAVASQLAQFTSGPVTRLAGADRYATGAAVARWFWGRVTPRAYVASGRSFADALAGGAGGYATPVRCCSWARRASRWRRRPGAPPCPAAARGGSAGRPWSLPPWSCACAR